MGMSELVSALSDSCVIFLTNEKNMSADAQAWRDIRRIALRSSLALVVLACALVSGCDGGQVAPAPAVSNFVYRLSGGDKIRLTVLGDTANTGEYAVDGEGVVSLPLAGNIPAKGMTLAEFRTAVETRMATYLRNPHIAAEVVNFRPVYILGDVTNPGEFPYAQGMTVYSLAAKAGGFTYRANTRSVFIRHGSEATETRYRLSSGTAVQPGDTIRIGQRVF